MERAKVLSLILVGLMSLGLASCGSDNNEGGAAVDTSTATNPITSNPGDNYVTTCQSASDFGDFKNRVERGEFLQERNNYETYYYVEQEADIDDKKFLWIDYQRIRWDYLGTFTRTGSRDSSSVSHEAGSTKTAVRDYLMSILNDATSGRDRSSVYNPNSPVGDDSYIEVLTSSGMIYGIDLCKPITANPVYEADTESGRVYYHSGTNATGGNGFQPL